MTRSNVRTFSANVVAVGFGLTVVAMLAGAEITALATKRSIDIWDFFLGSGVILLGIGLPLLIVTSARSFLLGPQ